MNKGADDPYTEHYQYVDAIKIFEELGDFISNEEEEITYNGKLLSNLGLTASDISFDISFDIIITTSNNISFKGTIDLNMPVETVGEEGASSKEITDFSNVVFKRI